MLASEVAQLARETELKQLSVKDDKTVILSYINLGILEIYKRFRLLRKPAQIVMTVGVTEYTLDGIDANVTIDLSNNQLLIIDEAFDIDGNELYINKNSDSTSLITPSYNIVQVPEDLIVEGETIDLVYRAAPVFLQAETETVPLPPQFLEPLLNYIGFKGHSSVKGDERTENNTHYKRFNVSCNNIIALGLHPNSSLESDKFEKRGFV